MLEGESLIERRWFIWLLMFIFWTVFSIVLTVQDVIHWYETHEKFESLSKLVFNTFPFYYTWFVLTPIVFLFGRKLPFGEEEKNFRNAIIHVFLGIFVVAVYLAITSFLNLVLVEETLDFQKILVNFSKRSYMVGHFQFVVYWAILGVYFSFDNYKKFRERKSEAARLLLHSTTLETQLAKAQLDSLKMQLHPHFLFNTLHAISALMEDNPKRARTMIARLGELLRSTLDIAEKQTITLEKEISLTKLYLGIEQERFGEMLRVKISVPTEEFDCMVPSLILQPLIENAIKHGVADEKTIAEIGINVDRLNKKIRIVVVDNGPGFQNDRMSNLQNGIGLSNTKARLEQLYAKEHEFNVKNNESGGARIEILIPCSKK